MTDDRKKSTLDALNNYSRKHSLLPKKRAKYKKPEKLVETDCVRLMRSWGWDVQIFESKATYSPKAGVWLQQSMKSGTLDCMATMPGGHSAFIEFKAKNARFRLRENQRVYILDKIEMGSFACVVDSAELLATIYQEWVLAIDKKECLISHLPKKKVQINGETDLDF